MQQANQQTFSEQRQVNKLLIVVCKFSTSTTDINAAQLHSFEWIYCPHRRSQVNEKTIIAANEEANYYEDIFYKKRANEEKHTTEKTIIPNTPTETAAQESVEPEMLRI